MATAAPGQSREPGTPAGSPMWVRDSHLSHLLPSSAAFPDTCTGGWTGSGVVTMCYRQRLYPLHLKPAPPKTNFLSDLSSYNTDVTNPRTLLFCLPIGIHVAFFFCSFKIRFPVWSCSFVPWRQQHLRPICSNVRLTILLAMLSAWMMA